jgi:ParB family transcriptional regulator, chromosome partitioning protein
VNILGMGVDAISVNSLHSEHNAERKHYIKNIQLNKIVMGHYRPRKTGTITTDSIQDLIASIKEQGVLQPIIVRKMEGEQYELIAGERRYRSALEASLIKIPCVIKDVSEKDAFAIALIENIQRKQLSLLEESKAFLRLKDEHFLCIDDVSKMIGKPRTTVANLIRVASLLSPEGKLLWENEDVEYGHILAVTILSHEFQNRVLQYVVDNKLSVRETEQIIREKKYFDLDDNNRSGTTTVKSSDLNYELKYIIDKFSAILGKNVSIKAMRSGKIRVSVEFEDVEKTCDFFKEKYHITCISQH